MAQTPVVQDLQRRLEKGGLLPCTNVSPGALPFLAALLRQLAPSHALLMVADGVKSQEWLHQDTATWLEFAALARAPATSDSSATQPPLYYPSWEILPHEDKLPHADVISERLETIVGLRSAQTHRSQASERKRSPSPSALIVTNLAALRQRTFEPQWLETHTRVLVQGQRLDPLDLVEWLEDLGYEPEIQVNHKGEIALRGGILDVYPLHSPWPVRVEFFGDEIESMRFFDPATQVSREPVSQVTLPPGGELGLLKRRLEGDKARSDGEEASVPTILEYLPERTILLLDEGASAALAAGQEAQAEARDPFTLSWRGLQSKLTRTGLVLIPTLGQDELANELSDVATALGCERSNVPVLNLDLPGLEAYRPILSARAEPQVAETQRREFFQQMHRWLRQGRAVHVFCNNQGEQRRFLEIWQEYGLAHADAAAGAPHTHVGALTRGFESVSGQAVVITDAEIFGRYKVQRPRRQRSPHAAAARSMLDVDFADLEEGELVVHLDHGIGRYLGLVRVPAGGGTKPLLKASESSEDMQECLAIEYAPSDPDQPPPKLYVPVTEAHWVGKYVGAGKARPALSALGGTRWRKAKEQAAVAVRDLAGELLSIQAARESQEGHAFGTDTPWQREFESAFLYEETPDQWRAIQETKADMERSKPMDRLICGDVGYGKTEVAIRAAFKAVMEGKQVAVLVPTTVLAQQHYNTWSERMADYPVRIELLSRFRTARQQREVLVQLAVGAVDIVVGTHRLIQRDVAFKDLGLVVVDEEQRFGVMHKEQFKRLRRLVDVLTLSATPIPRTLYLALTGARDMSTIQTPPQDRLPVETIVSPYDERLIRDAITRELNRQGQVFYLHNRIVDIETRAQRLQELVPEARIVVGHGQMHADDLERVMTQFVGGEADLLLSTTIIESGLDIPNANTIIIERADRFGLSDLYQLRGRVGRYKHQAYAYLLIPRHARMLTDARKRISAIKQYSTLGSGFKIAMRDLEIRGAGNLLGAQQSGHITAVGFDLYCQLLKQSVAALQGRPVPRRVNVALRLDFLRLNPGRDLPETPNPPPPPRRSPAAPPASPRVPRDPDAAATPDASDDDFETAVVREAADPSTPEPVYAFVPMDYVADPAQRIDVYRKLGNLMEPEDADQLSRELRDRFGPLPAPLELLLEAARLRILGATKELQAIETRGDRLMLMRQGDWITVGGKFPRLAKRGSEARLKEIAGAIQALSSARTGG